MARFSKVRAYDKEKEDEIYDTLRYNTLQMDTFGDCCGAAVLWGFNTGHHESILKAYPKAIKRVVKEFLEANDGYAYVVVNLTTAQLSALREPLEELGFKEANTGRNRSTGNILHILTKQFNKPRSRRI